jgi:HK97 family phage major capsid protein
MNDATRASLAKLKTGVASDARYLWAENLEGSQPATLFGRPVISSSAMPVLAATKKVVAFGDLSYYYVADRPSTGFTRLNELYAANGLIGFVANRRVDGELTQSEAVKHLTTT